MTRAGLRPGGAEGRGMQDPPAELQLERGQEAGDGVMKLMNVLASSMVMKLMNVLGSSVVIKDRRT